jgi:hypothetical protein
MEEIIELDLGILPEAAISGAVLFETEQSTTLTFNAMRYINELDSDGDRRLTDAGTAIFRFKRCIATRFGYPNDEARWEIPRFKNTSYGIYEVRNSSWIRDTIRDNRYQFPDTKDNYVKKHLLFTFHSSTFECLTDDFEFEVSIAPYDELLTRVTGQAFTYRPKRYYHARRNNDGSMLISMENRTLEEQRKLLDTTEFLFVVEAATHEEAAAIYNLRMGFGPYTPMGEPANCPHCDSWYYPQGSGECWQCSGSEVY